jgi:hypothetical protein
MNAMYDSKAVPLDAYQGAFAWAEHQTGVLFAFGSETMGLDLMDEFSERPPYEVQERQLHDGYTAARVFVRLIRRPREQNRTDVRGCLPVQDLNQGGPWRGRIVSRKSEPVVGTRGVAH